MIMTKVNEITKKYGNKTVLDHVSFSVKKGECLGILGHNGAGKTTLIETMLGLKKADEGQVIIFDHNMAKRKQQLFEKVGVQLQHSAYQAKIKVHELCQERAVLYQTDIDEDRLLTDFGLLDKKNQMVESLSGGEKQKLSILLAIMHEPELIFLDELTTGLDVVARREIWKYLLQLKKNNKSLILTSHYMDEVETLCDRILLLKDGKELISGTVQEVIENSPYDNLEKAFLWYMGEEVLL
ncbi:ABC transporter ATP-binding protein [Beduini massiliensis]|uniref:ABC transporter ATP-binding protein n=1 Tax=Beduini massiliensis TaxID=1585974 RepID=UPI00059AA4F4|nr:ABC transporter ATP-binding protein [Beduini massiliensis]